MQEYIKRSQDQVNNNNNNNNTILIIPNDEMKKLIKIVEFLEDSSLLPEGVSETVQN